MLICWLTVSVPERVHSLDVGVNAAEYTCEEIVAEHPGLGSRARQKGENPTNDHSDGSAIRLGSPELCLDGVGQR
jgi:hypothetical protein